MTRRWSIHPLNHVASVMLVLLAALGFGSCNAPERSNTVQPSRPYIWTSVVAPSASAAPASRSFEAPSSVTHTVQRSAPGAGQSRTDVPPDVVFMGTLQRGASTWAIFADCGNHTYAARPGESFLGIWSVVSIDTEVAVIQHLDGHRARLPMSGCATRR